MDRFSLDASGAVEVIQRKVFDGQSQVHKVTTVEALVRAQCGRVVRCAWLLNSRCVALRWLGPFERAGFGKCRGSAVNAHHRAASHQRRA